MQHNDIFWVTDRMDSQAVMTFPRRGVGNLGSPSFKNASGQEVTCPLGPR